MLNLIVILKKLGNILLEILGKVWLNFDEHLRKLKKKFGWKLGKFWRKYLSKLWKIFGNFEEKFGEPLAWQYSHRKSSVLSYNDKKFHEKRYLLTYQES